MKKLLRRDNPNPPYYNSGDRWNYYSGSSDRSRPRKQQGWSSLNNVDIGSAHIHLNSMKSKINLSSLEIEHTYNIQLSQREYDPEHRDNVAEISDLTESEYIDLLHTVSTMSSDELNNFIANM